MALDPLPDDAADALTRVEEGIRTRALEACRVDLHALLDVLDTSGVPTRCPARRPEDRMTARMPSPWDDDDTAKDVVQVEIPKKGVRRRNPCARQRQRRQRRQRRHALRVRVMARDGWTCVYCGCPATTLDHVKPKSAGGKATMANLVAACRPCNEWKGDGPPLPRWDGGP